MIRSCKKVLTLAIWLPSLVRSAEGRRKRGDFGPLSSME